jgi:NADH-quinone oxidoreductase subunit E
MKNDPTFDMPSDMASAVNLIAHPLAGAAAMTALGLGLASQTIGVWMGAMAGVAQASQQVFSSLADETKVGVSKAAMSAKQGAKRSRPALKVVKREAGAEFSRPTPIDRPDTPDALKAISGIGPKLEQVLNGLGVWTHSQIAAWGERETGWLDDYLGLQGRIDRDGWVAQAARLVAEKTKH